MPSSRQRALEKAKTIKADAYIFDLEDAVSPEQKELARQQAVAAAREQVETKAYGMSEICIRVNGRTTPWYASDVEAVATSGADAVLLPKAESRDDVADLVDRLDAAGAKPSMEIWCMVETPRGVSNVEELAAHPRVTALLMGTVDLANDLRCKPMAPGRFNLQYALQRCVIAARTAGISALDGVYVDLQNEEGFIDECHQGRDLGFDGKTLIHPKTVAQANEFFSPSAADIDHAERVIAAHEDAIRTGSGVATVDGKLVENLHYRNAKRTLAIVERIKARA
ncbi:Citrate lyase subunit beta-like protein, mitochondrial [Hondaea fermentalgiana]|uniref:Citrate lyase subunit beta-like protein, mitochondrial n=1 Tax=Hondaea fermentalgiana TaxID=2315210 RepID=A0A2R5G4M2_9STRA|nr:Citrate lyase subunit beta-like protein, mitochondrial [Hondaea fermentalgiana]|eukprot:GBG24738.1 Citrate lyase subunit beta-like protein, mitochondrial [Hondaea fermentalgiana]